MIEETLKELISFKSVTFDKKESKKALSFVRSKVPKGVRVKEKEYNGYPTLTIGSNSPTICLQAHIDVVNGSKEMFIPKKRGNRLYGRGSYDMKFAISCYLKLLTEIDIEKHSVGIMITSDEEMGGFNGVKRVLEDGYRPSYCFLPDGEKEWNIDCKTKGAFHLKVTVKGKSGHASRLWEGDSATSRLIDFLQELQSFFPKVREEAFQNTLNIGKIEGGEATNQIAKEATACLDIRFISQKDGEEIKKKIGLLKKKHCVAVKEVVSIPFFSCDSKNYFFRYYQEVAKKHRRKLTKKASHATSDARYFSNRNIPVLLTRPKGGGAHSEREWIDLNDLSVFYSILKEFSETFANKA